MENQSSTTNLLYISFLVIVILVLVVVLAVVAGVLALAGAATDPSTDMAVEPTSEVIVHVPQPTVVPAFEPTAMPVVSPGIILPRETVIAGKTMYMTLCISCHGANTEGTVGNLIGKNLVNNEFVQNQNDAELLAFIRAGRAIDDPVNTTGVAMPPSGGNLDFTDDDLLNIIAYLRTLDNGASVEGGALLTGEVVGSGETDYRWAEVVSGLDNPLFLTHAGDGSGRLFIVEQTGFILIVDSGALRSEPFLDIAALAPYAVYEGGYSEQGLLGLAFHPDYAENGLFFISYTNRDGDSVIARYSVSADDPNRADPESAVVLLTVDQPYEDHNAGNIIFGPDGYLYISFGDGGRPALPNYRSQDPILYLGKLLRIDVNADTYVVPEDNPFINKPDYQPEIWAMGLRNPWRFSFDRLTGDLYIADVGQWIWEELNFQPAGDPGGQNYGWSAYEATHLYLDDATVFGGVHTPPILEYDHSQGCSITGGYVYRGAALEALQGQYFYGDYCSGYLWTAIRNTAGVWQNELFFNSGLVISSFGEDEQGELYLIDYKGGVYRLEAN